MCSAKQDEVFSSFCLVGSWLCIGHDGMRMCLPPVGVVVQRPLQPFSAADRYRVVEEVTALGALVPVGGPFFCWSLGELLEVSVQEGFHVQALLPPPLQSFTLR